MQSAQKTQFTNRSSKPDTQRLIRRDLRHKQVMYVINVNVTAAGVPVQLPSVRMLPGMEALAKVGPSNSGALYLAKHRHPRASAGVPGAGAFTLVNSAVGVERMDLDGDNLSQWWADADDQSFLQVIVFMNRQEPFVP